MTAFADYYGFRNSNLVQWVVKRINWIRKS